MKTKWWIVALVLAGHVVAVGILLVSQGCGLLRGRRTSEQPLPPPLPAATRPTTVSTARPPMPGTTRTTGPAVAPAPTARPAPAVRPVPDATTHTVAKGETLSSIANQHGLSVGELAALNSIQDKNKLRIGQKLVIPAGTRKPAPKPAPAKPEPTAVAAPGASSSPLPPGTLYQVKAGDTLSGIAKRHGVKVDTIRKANALASDRIRVGQKLVIPDSDKPVSPAPPATDRMSVDAPKTNAPSAGGGTTVEPVAPPAPTKTMDPAAKAVEPPQPIATPVAKPVAAPAAKPAAVTAAKSGGAAAPVAPPAGADAKMRIHVVEKGEDLYSVSLLWGVSIEELKRVNGLQTTALEEGMRLKIPVSGP